jgi:hypothetical protein
VEVATLSGMKAFLQSIGTFVARTYFRAEWCQWVGQTLPEASDRRACPCCFLLGLVHLRN